MNTLIQWFDGKMIDDIVTTLLHNLWQGILLAMALWIYFKTAKPSSSRKRYAVSFLALMVLMAMSLLTFSAIRMYRAGATNTAQINHRNTISNSNISTNPNTISAITTPEKSTPPSDTQSITIWNKLQQHWRGLVFILYALGTGFMIVRLLVRLGGTYSLKKSAAPDEATWRKMIYNEVASKIRVAKHVALAVSDKIIIPCTIGFVKPVILLPAVTLTGLDESQLRAILAHELMQIIYHSSL